MFNNDALLKKYIYFLFSLLFFSMLSCKSEDSSLDDMEIIKLNKYKVIIFQKSNTLGIPVIIRHDQDSNFFVYDVSNNQMFEFDLNGKVVKKIGRAGRGPGEYSFINNIFFLSDRIFVIDNSQLFVHQYDREGKYLSSFDFGRKDGRPTIPSPPFGIVKPMRIVNQPHITIQNDILLSTVNVGETDQTIFEMFDWKDGTSLSQFGNVPEGSSFILDNLKLRNEASNGQVPSFYRANSFPVQDRANPDEFFVVYTALSKIAKYKVTGEKLWEKEVESSETIAIREWFFETMERMAKSSDIRDRVGLQFYSSGTSSEDGDLYLVVNINPVVIHKFNNKGDLVNKYKFTTDEVTPVLDFDFANQRILVATENGEIRAYPF